MRYYRELSGTDWWIVNQRSHQNLTKTFRPKSFGLLRFESWQKSNGSLNGSLPFARAWLTKGVVTWDRDELRPVWVRIGLHTFLFLRLHGTGLNERDELLRSNMFLVLVSSFLLFLSNDSITIADDIVYIDNISKQDVESSINWRYACLNAWEYAILRYCTVHRPPMQWALLYLPLSAKTQPTLGSFKSSLCH